MNLPELAEAARIPESMLLDTIDELQRSQEQLRQQAARLLVQNKELDAYASMVAHDLKDPLAILVMTSDLINDVPDLTPQELKESLQQIRSTAYELNGIIDSLLLFAEVDKVQAPLEPLDMLEVLSKVQNRLSSMIMECKARIKIPKILPNAIGYAPWIEEVWANYISNAVKHGGQPPEVELGASALPDGMLRFWTRDNGPGLPPDAQAQLFTPFSQLCRLRDTGHGLGLSITLQIVEKLGGQVGVESEVGQGSLFYFTLPAGPAPETIRPG